MSKVTYNVIYQVCGQVTTDIPDDITTREEARLSLTWRRTGKTCLSRKAQSISAIRKSSILKERLQ